MLKILLLAFVSIFSFAVSISAQETRPTPRPSPAVQTTTPRTTPRPSGTPSRPQTTPPTTTTQETREGGGTTQYASTGRRVLTPTERAVRAQFERLLEGIRQADVETVMSVYWNSPQLTLFNNNGTVTRGWSQVRANRESSYPNLADVTLNVRDARVHILSPSSAVVSCLWTQSQTARGTPETASGRLTIVFQLVGGEWRAVHTHTSPDAPDPSRILPSERTTTPPDDPR
jgi:ketosteroid isomerase-like protein